MTSKQKFILPAIIIVIIFTGLLIRLYHITDNQFLFYDEGMYLGYNRQFLDLVANNPAHNLNEFGIILSLMFKTALTTAKALWFLILNLRVFLLGPEAWFFARLISAVSGLATVVLLYFWAKRYYHSKAIAVLSSCVLLILPSHVFYSRLGMQESLSTLLFLSAVYLYMFPSRSHDYDELQEHIRWPFFVSAFLLACVYFTNYRMIIAPIFIAFIECFNAFITGKKMNWKKAAIYFASFYGVVFMVGGLYGGVNLHVTFAWMFHQAQDAGGKFDFINFLSYPYYVFALEGVFFACFFWGSIYLFKLKEYSKLLPFALVIMQMLMFSFAAEKGARYLCVVLPFLAAAAAVVADDCWQRYAKARRWLLMVGALAFVGMVYLSGSIAMARTDYDKAVQFITGQDPQAEILSTQPLVEALFVTDEKKIIPCPNNLYLLLSAYKQGARYLILDPQAYITWTNDGRRFSPPLDDFLETVLKDVQPLQIFPHLNNILLTRFVLDHNEQIVDSLKFLSVAKSEEYGKIRIYDLESILKRVAR